MASHPKRQKKMAESSVDRLVGKFIRTWNLLESQLNSTIRDVYEIDQLHSAILTANLHFQTKMHIVRVMVNLLGVAKPSPWKESANKTLNKIQSINDDWRILIAHNVAISVNMTTIKFLKISAKRKLAFPDPRKTKKEFSQINADMFDCMDGLEQITADLKGTSLARAIASAPTQSWPSLADLDRLLPPTQGTPHSPSDPATGGILGGTFANPPPKEGRK
jgi:hypothetical protein